MTSAWSWIGAACVAGVAVAAGCSKDRGPKPPNVVVILVDTLRPDHLQPYGYPHPTTPYLAELASRGVLFERAYSASTWTAPATASLFTGLYPNQHGVLEGFFVQHVRAEREERQGRRDGAAPGDEEGEAGELPRDEHPHAERAEEELDRWEGRPTAVVSLNRIPDAVATAPELFAQAGYRTFAVSCNVNVTERIGFQRGFARFADFTGPQHGKGAGAETVLDQVRAWKSELLSDQPYFLYLHFNDVHAPRRPRPALYEPGGTPMDAERAAYDGELRYLDDTLRQLHAELAWSDQTLICVVSDHGEEFGEHGRTGHGFSLHAELMRIALLFSWPAQLDGPRRVDAPVSIIDVLPTLAQLAGVPLPKGLAGVSLAPALAGRTPPPERSLFALRFRDAGAVQMFAVQRGRWKLILSGKGPRLYDHESDPFEQHDLARRRPELVESMMQELRAFRALEPVSAGGKVEVELDAAALRALEQLGYTDAK